MMGKFWEHRYNQFMDGKVSAGQIKKELHALEAFRKAADETSVYGNERIVIGDHLQRKEEFKSVGIYNTRREITAAKCTLYVAKKVHNHINTSTNNGSESQKVNRFQSITGGRITATLKLKAENIRFDDKTQSIMVFFEKDKNKFSRNVPLYGMNKEDYQFVKDLVGDKEGRQQIFSFKKENGKDMNLKEARKTVQTYTKEAAKTAGVYANGSRFNTHSNRKAFAQAQYDSLKYTSKKELKRMISRYISHQGSNSEQILERMHNELNNLSHF